MDSKQKSEKFFTSSWPLKLLHYCFKTTPNSYKVDRKIQELYMGSRLQKKNLTSCDHSGRIISIAASKEYFVSGSDDTTIRIWDLNNSAEFIF